MYPLGLALAGAVIFPVVLIRPRNSTSKLRRLDWRVAIFLACALAVAAAFGFVRSAGIVKFLHEQTASWRLGWHHAPKGGQ